jgi:hypothetical protein
LIGHWVGTNDLWLSPEEPCRKSPTEAVVALAAQGKFVTIQYTWADDGAPQDGLLMLGYERQLKTVRAVWIDSWHMGDKFMLCQGTDGATASLPCGAEGRSMGFQPMNCHERGILVKGSYSAPPGPDWGWQIGIEPEHDGKFRIVMHNVSPDGKAALAVEATYVRKP